jgi:hypothetical protein
MPSSAVNAAIDALRARLQAELDSQLTSLQTTIDDRHQEELAEARRVSAAEAQERWSARLDALRAEWTARLRTEVDGASAASARTHAAEVARLQAEKDSAVHAAVHAHTLGRDTSDVSRAALQRLAGTLRAISDAATLTAALDALADGAAAEAPHTALFVVSGRGSNLDSAGASSSTNGAAEGLEQWRSVSLDDEEGPPAIVAAAGAMAHAVRTRQPTVATGESRDPKTPQPGRSALVVPVVVGDKTVAVLYVEGEADANADSVWPDSIKILCQHASACLSQLTAVRVAQALGGGRSTSTTSEDDGSARRYARLLVSEIKLYNEAAVRTGRERRDLLARLRPEIERARRLYEERVPISVGHRATLFQQELVQTLAEGDPDLLGASA